MKKLSLMEVLEGIEDTRRERSVWYPLQEVLFIMLIAVICGATSYKKVVLYPAKNQTKEGYSLASLILASAERNCQLTLPPEAFRRRVQERT